MGYVEFEFQSMTFAPDDSPLSSDQNNQFFYIGGNWIPNV